jgi:predicted metalloenzyme YecM
MQLQAIVGDYQAFLEQILQEIVDAGFDLSDFSQMDHMCYRVSSVKDYEAKKSELSKVARLLGETQVNDRPISTFRLREPIRFENWRIDAIELPAPKPGVETKQGLEHVELVLFDDKDDFLRKHAGKTFDLKAADRGVNPEIAFKLPTYSVKFHLLALPTVIYLEDKLGMTDIRDGK